MQRILIIAFAAFVGAIGTWFFIPTVQKVPVNKDMPIFASDRDPTERPDAVDPPKGMMSSEDRRERAEQLIGESLKYITPDAVRGETWYAEQGKAIIERAMDECYLILEYHQYAHEDAPAGEHAELAEGGWGEEILTLPTPTTQQTANCLNVYRAYFAMHGKKFEF